VSEISIYFAYDSDLSEYEASSKGYRTDVFVKIGNNIYNLRIYSMIRLQQDFESEIVSYGFYMPEPNLVLVNDVNKDEIIKIVQKLYEQKYFEEIKSINNIETSQLVNIARIVDIV